MDRYICVHGHFYQPPRENPWLEAVELQDSAYPYHDWNERITVECYQPNTASRILNGDRRIVQIVNNYANISFNFGPTLLAWLQDRAPDVYQGILAADRQSQQRFSGHGSALAQAYNHMILPLANGRDKATQIRWGIHDFTHRFGRRPEGMWLPETAVDIESLELIAAEGIAFTILAPHQARRWRSLPDGEWHEVNGADIDPTRPYLQRLPSGRTISIFFYDGPISRAVAFEGLLHNGPHFARRLMSGFDDGRAGPQLVHIATDGETYGHHHRHGDMALAYALHHIETNGLAQLTIYGEYLERFPPAHEVEIAENTAWSCAHGLERWRSDCGCHTGARPEWNQEWRGPLRDALNWLRDTVAPLYEAAAAPLLHDPWAARDQYIAVILDRSPDNVRRFLAAHARYELADAETVTALKLLEMQRHAQLMYTSCGWFFDDLSGIETVQDLQYAGRTIQLAREVLGRNLESAFRDRLARARANLPDQGNGAQIYEKYVVPAMVDLQKVAAHYAMSSLFTEYAPHDTIYSYTVENVDHRQLRAGMTRLALGRGRVRSAITWEAADVTFAVLHFGDHNLNGAVREFQGEAAYQAMVDQVTAAFERFDLSEVIRLMDQIFAGVTYSLRLLFRDQQREILNQILAATLNEMETVHRQIYEHHAPLMRFIASLGMPLPGAFHAAASLMLTMSLRRALSDPECDVDRIAELLNEAGSWQVELDAAGLEYALEHTIDNMATTLRNHPKSPPIVHKIERVLDLVQKLPFPVELGKLQNVYYEVQQAVYPDQRRLAEAGDGDAAEWVRRFDALGDGLLVVGGS